MDTAAFGSPSAVTPYMYAPSRAHSETHGPRATSTARKLSSCVLIEMPHATDLATEHGTRFGIPRMTCDLYTKVTRVTAHTRRDLTGSGTVSIHSRRMRKTVSTVQLVSPRDALFASLAFIRSNIAPNLRRASSSRLDPTSSSASLRGRGRGRGRVRLAGPSPRVSGSLNTWRTALIPTVATDSHQRRRRNPHAAPRDRRTFCLSAIISPPCGMCL
jgi:hypothetical protein